MTTKTLDLSTDLNEMSEADMLSIAYDLNSIEPGAGVPMVTDASFWSDFAIAPETLLNVMGVVLFIVWALVVFSPSVSQYFRMFKPMGK